jgi:hypothetical protein
MDDDEELFAVSYQGVTPGGLSPLRTTADEGDEDRVGAVAVRP